jgi:hypothetical protein
VVIALLSLAGEPALIALTLLLATSLATIEGRLRGGLWFLACVVLASLLTLPVHIATVHAAADSARVRLGFTAEHGTSGSLHPLRLLEIPFPLFFGNPSRLLAGAWWGYNISDGMLPYVSSLSIGFVPFLLIVGLACSIGFRRYRFWWITIVVSLVMSCSGYLPGAAAAYASLRPLHVVRFPIKFYLLTTFATAVLSAFAFDELATANAIVRRRVLLLFGGVTAASLAAAVFVHQRFSDIAAMIVRHLWSPAWRSSPDTVLRPILESISGRCVIIAALAFACFLWVGRARGKVGHFLLILVAVGDVAARVAPLMPTVDVSVYTVPSPLVASAQALQGRIYERTEKDLTPVVFGLRGHYATDDTRELAAVQARQAWPLTGVQFGLRYAFDQCPDGSYTARNQLIEDLLSRADWPHRIKWLRAAGVAGVISSNVPANTAGLRVIYRENATVSGIPTTLYELEQRLPEVRRIGRIVGARTQSEAVRLFDNPTFNPAEEVVIEGAVPASGPHDARDFAHTLRDTADRVEIATSGLASAVLFVTRSYTSRTAATVKGTSAPVYPANVHLVGVPVPPGRSTVVLTWD